MPHILTRLGVAFILLITVGCLSPLYKQPQMKTWRGDHILSEPNTFKNGAFGPLDIKSSGLKVGTLYTDTTKTGIGHSPLIFKYNEGKKIILWRCYDYSGITKITQSADERTIRIYHWYALLVHRNYLTELDLEKGEVNGYRLPEGSQD